MPNLVPDFDRSDSAEILRFAQLLVGKRIDQVLDVPPGPASGSRTKGVVGAHYERIFGIKTNSDARPDFPKAGVELKSVPLERIGRGLRVKERCSLTTIDYSAVLSTPLGKSHLWAKTRQILFVFYEWSPGVPMTTFRTAGVTLWSPGSLEESLLRKTYKYIKTRVNDGQAHLITDVETAGVTAPTKGSGKKIPQPKSSVLAKERAFAFSDMLVNSIWESMQSSSRQESVLGAASGATSPEQRLMTRLTQHEGKTVDQIQRRIKRKAPLKPKNRADILSRLMLGSDVGTRPVMELERLGLTLKSVRVNSQLKPYQSMSFGLINFSTVVDESWETSKWREQVSRILFVVFEGPSDAWGDLTLRGSFIWSPTRAEELVLKAEWERAVSLIRTGDIKKIPGQSESVAVHVRPKSTKGAVPKALPSGGRWVGSSFWLNRPFVQAILQEALG